MHPEGKVMVLKIRAEGNPGHLLQIFTMGEEKEKVGGWEFGDEVVFWKWMGNDLLAVVTRTEVFHLFYKEP